LVHDAIRAATLLREIFANDRTRVGFLLGAGCPFSIAKPLDAQEATDAKPRVPLIPDIRGLTTAVRARLQDSHPALLTKLDTFLASQGVTDANVEDILSKIRAVAEVVGTGSVHGFRKDEILEIERSICAEISELVSAELPRSPNGYSSISRWIKGLNRTSPVEIFTTNYDLLIESALERDHVTTFDGFTGSHRPFFDLSAIERDGLPPHWVRVWKLHGSVNWREVPKSETSPASVHRVSNKSDFGKSVIHPSNQKYDQSRRLPYLALIDRLKIFIRKPSAVLIINGYSFGDEHINEVIVDGLENNPTAVVISTVYGRLESYPVLVDLASRCANLTAMAEDLAIVGKKKGAWTYDPEQGSGVLRLAFDFDTNNDGWSGGNTRFLLGNFEALGAFVEDVCGTFKQVERAANA